MSSGDEPEGRDEPDEPDEPDGSDRTASRDRGPDAAYSSNWLTVLIVDGAMGAGAILVGVILAIAWNPVSGGFVASLGLGYVLLVTRRGRRWANWRRRAGL